MSNTMTERRLKGDELALIHTPEQGLRLELPQDDLPIDIDGAVLAGVFVRLQHDKAWADELKHWVMAQVPEMSVVIN
jgi:hypothetical protein